MRSIISTATIITAAALLACASKSEVKATYKSPAAPAAKQAADDASDATEASRMPAATAEQDAVSTVVVSSEPSTPPGAAQHGAIPRDSARPGAESMGYAHTLDVTTFPDNALRDAAAQSLPAAAPSTTTPMRPVAVYRAPTCSGGSCSPAGQFTAPQQYQYQRRGLFRGRFFRGR